MRKWLRFALAQLERMLLVLGVIFAYVAIHDRMGRGDQKTGALTLTVTRSAGESAQRSRCGECTQPGDLITAAAHGPSGLVRGVRVYTTTSLLVACTDCSALSFAIQAFGQHTIIGFQASKPCTITGAGLDADVLALSVCEAQVTSSRIESR